MASHAALSVPFSQPITLERLSRLAYKWTDDFLNMRHPADPIYRWVHPNCISVIRHNLSFFTVRATCVLSCSIVPKQDVCVVSPAGVSQVLKEHDPDVKVVLVDPPGSSLFNKVTPPTSSVAHHFYEPLERMTPDHHTPAVLA